MALILAHGPVQTPSIGFNYDTLPPTTAITDYAMGVEILSVFFDFGAKMEVTLHLEMLSVFLWR